MIEIVEFERKANDILIGYRQKNAVVFASVSAELNDDDAKQRGYEQVRKALAYELSLDNPSIDGSDMEALEVFTPQEPYVKEVVINGDRFISFEDSTTTKEVTYTITAFDQYGEIYSESTVIETFKNDDYIHEVSVTIDGVTNKLDVQVYKYVEPSEPEPSEIDILKMALIELDIEKQAEIDILKLALIEQDILINQILEEKQNG